jgi:phosphoglycerol transferase MdoB-like AlkP superfamily enzyme
MYIQLFHRILNYLLLGGMAACIFNLFRLLNGPGSDIGQEMHCSYVGLGLMLLVAGFIYLFCLLIINWSSRGMAKPGWAWFVGAILLLVFGYLPALYILIASFGLR